MSSMRRPIVFGADGVASKIGGFARPPLVTHVSVVLLSAPPSGTPTIRVGVGYADGSVAPLGAGRPTVADAGGTLVVELVNPIIVQYPEETIVIDGVGTAGASADVFVKYEYLPNTLDSSSVTRAPPLALQGGVFE